MDKEQVTQEAMIRDLELQWKDHFHMRDQTWKTLTNSVLFFIGIVGLELKDVGNFAMIPLYIILMFITLVGWIVAAHHRIRQGQKFAIIQIYEEKLGLYGLKEKVLEDAKIKGSLIGKVFTARFIEITQIGIGLVALILVLRRILLFV